MIEKVIQKKQEENSALNKTKSKKQYNFNKTPKKTRGFNRNSKEAQKISQTPEKESRMDLKEIEDTPKSEETSKITKPQEDGNGLLDSVLQNTNNSSPKGQKAKKMFVKPPTTRQNVKVPANSCSYSHVFALPLCTVCDLYFQTP